MQSDIEKGVMAWETGRKFHPVDRPVHNERHDMSTVGIDLGDAVPRCLPDH